MHKAVQLDDRPAVYDTEREFGQGIDQTQPATRWGLEQNEAQKATATAVIRY